MERRTILTSNENLGFQPESVKPICQEPPPPIHLVDGLYVKRGLILAHNRRKRYLRDTDMHRWLAYSARVLDCSKVDVLALGSIPQSLISTVWYARELSMHVSLRTNGSASPNGLEYLVSEGLEDVLLCPEGAGDNIEQWLDTCGSIGVPVRMHLLLSRIDFPKIPSVMETWRKAGVRSVSLSSKDPFRAGHGSQMVLGEKAVADICNMLSDALWDNGMECNIIGVSEEMLAPRAKACLVTRPTEKTYDGVAYRMARRLFERRPEVIRTALLVEIKRHTVTSDITDRWVLNTLFVKAPFIHQIVTWASKVWRARYGTSFVRKGMHDAGMPLEFTLDAFPTNKVIPDNTGHSHPPEVEVSPRRPRYLDRADRDRLYRLQEKESLAREALDWQRDKEPSLVRDMKNWGTTEAFLIPEYGATSWLTYLPGRRLSDVIGDLLPPFIISMTVGGGVAEAVGFRLGDSLSLMCPMTEARHTLSLYANHEGYYVLLRDGIPVEPVAYPGDYTCPERIPSAKKFLMGRVSVVDVEDRISFSSIRIWKDPPQKSLACPKYSVVIFCTRFARRLSPVLQCLAHQGNYPLSRLEVIVGYVPGLDSTEDVLQSMRCAYPNLKIVHAVFPKKNICSKGYVLNQCMEMASGEWLILLDADTLLPPDMFAALERVESGKSFVFPRGRLMMDPDITARILLGDIRPWQEWNTLALRATELRKDEALGAPIGYCQCFRRELFERIRYPEYEHFQGADFEFAMALRKECGEEYRLDFPVMHLDHQGSQWFGTDRHF